MRGDFVIRAYGPGSEELRDKFVEGSSRDDWILSKPEWFVGGLDECEAALDYVSLDVDELVNDLRLLTSERPGCRVSLLARGADSGDSRLLYVAAGAHYEEEAIDTGVRNEQEIFDALEKGAAIPNPTQSSLLVIKGPLAEEFPERVFKGFPVMQDAQILERTKGYLLTKVENRPLLDADFRYAVQRMAKSFPDNGFLTHTYMEESYGKELDAEGKAYARTAMTGYMGPLTDIVQRGTGLGGR